jgi:hypothetical protein
MIRALLLLAPAGAASTVLMLALAGARAEEPREETEAVPIRRVLLPPERVAAEMQRARLGALKQISLADFETLVRRANRAAAALKKVPQLLEARFRARLEDNDLVGSAEWKVHNPGPATRLLPLDPFNIALRKHPRFENRDAFVGEFDGTRPGLLLEEPGQRSVILDWSSRGEASPDGLRFDLQLPSCPVTTLDLYLPPDRAVAVSPEGCTVSGPMPAESDNERLWRIGFAGRSPVDLRVRRLEHPGHTSALLTARLESKQYLLPDGVEAEYQFNLKAMHQEIRELECECDPALRPYEVVAPGLEKWELHTGPVANAPTRLTIHLREPLRTGFFTVRGTAPLPRSEKPEDAWTSPAVRLLHAVPLGEKLLLRVHPEVHLEDWRPGHFRLQESTMEPDGARAITLLGGGIDASPPAGAEVPRPQARIAAPAALLQARQLAWWQVQADKSSLTCQITYEALRGQVFQLPLDLPAGWHVESVEVPTPAGLLRSWEVRPERGVATLVVDLHRPLGPRSATTDAKASTAVHSASVTVRLTAAGPALEWAFPDVTPRGVYQREGALAIDFDEQVYRARVEATAAPAEPAEREDYGPWGSQVPDYYYRYYGEPVRGTLRLQPREPRVTVRCASDVVFASGRAALVAHLLLQPEVGSPSTLDFLISAPAAGKWEWRNGQGGTNSVRSFEPARHTERALLGLLSARTLLDFLACARVGADCFNQPEHWRLTLTRPLREPLQLDVGCEVARTADGRWNVPLLALAAPHHSEGEVTLYLAGADLVRVETHGLHEATSAVATPRIPAGSPWRTFRYGARPASLVLQAQPAAADPSSAVIIDRAALATYVEPSGRLLHHYRFHLGNWKQRTLPLRLPADASLLAARIDGHWIAQSPLASPVEGTLLVELPALGARESAQAWHRYDVVFAENRVPWRLATTLHTPASILPVAPLSLRRTWFLPPGVAPLYDSQCRCLPAANNDRSSEQDLPFPLSGGWLPISHWPLAGDSEAEQQRRMTDAAAAVAMDRASLRTLGDLLDRLASDAPAETPIIVDIDALGRAGLRAETPLPPGSARETLLWEAIGLVYVPARAAPLLTTRGEWESWQTSQTAGRREPALTASLEDAVAEAAAKGHDGSGRFRTAADWLRDQDRRLEQLGFEASDALKPALGFLNAEYWTAWEAIAGTESDRTLVVVRHDVLSRVGPVLAALLCLAFWGLRNSLGRWRLTALLLWLTVAGLGYLWLPSTLRMLAWWPFLAAAIALAWYLASAVRKQSVSASGPKTDPRAGAAPLVTASLLLGIGAGWWVIASPSNADDAAREQTVFLVPAAEGDSYNVLAPPKLLEQLEAQANRADLARPGCAVVSANYEGKLVGDAMEFQAEYLVYALDEGPAVLSLPLDGVQLDGETWLDGARAYPAAARPPATGYTLRIEKRSPPLHRVQMRFRVAVDAAGEERDAQLTLPPVVQSRLTLNLPKGARSPRALIGQAQVRGAQRILAVPDGSRLEAELGRFNAQLRLHWLQEGAPAKPTQVQVREAYLWDLRPDATTLTALLRYSISQGAVPNLALDIPERLDVLNVELSSPPGRAAQLKDWRMIREGKSLSAFAASTTGLLSSPLGQGPVLVASELFPGRAMPGEGSGRRLEVEFQSAITGELTLVVQFGPRRPFASGEELPLPAPRAAQSLEGLLACQFTNLEAHPQARGLTVSSREQFAALWKAQGRVDPRVPWQPALAFSFQRGGNAAPLLQLNLRLAAAPVQAVQQITWKVGPDQAEFQATCAIKAGDSEVTLVEWDVPPEVTITRIGGRDVVSWSQCGRRVQAWLDTQRRSTELRLAGWMKTPAASDASAGQVGSREFHLPCLCLLDAPAPQIWLRLVGTSGLTLKMVSQKELLPLPDLAPSAEYAFYTMQPHYSGTFRLVQSQTVADARVLTIADVRGGQLVCNAVVDYQIRQGEPRSVIVQLRDWPGSEVHFEALDGVARVQTGSADGVRLWTLDLQPGGSGRYRFALGMSLPLDQALRGVPMPHVLLPGAARVERWLALASSPDLQAEGSQGLERVADAGRALGPWAEPLRRTAQTAWRAVADDWRLELRPRPRRDTPSIQIFLAEHEAAVLDGRRWVYQTTFWLYHEANAVTCRLPARAQLLAVALDDSALTPLQPAAGQLWVPLPGSAGSRRLRLRWTFHTGEERLERPRLLAPHLEGVDDGPILWTIHVPNGYEPTPSSRQQAVSKFDAEAATASDGEVCRAEAQLRLSTVLANKMRPGDSGAIPALAAAQQRFYRACRHAELGSNGSADSTARLSELREQNVQLARQYSFEAMRAEAERQARLYRPPAGNAAGPDEPGTRESAPPILPVRSDLWWGDPLPWRGTALYWQSTRGGLVLPLVLTPVRAKEVRRAWSASVLLVVLLAAAWVLAQFPGLRSGVRVFWPEQVALLGCLMWQTFGPSLLVVFLVLLGVCARLVQLVQFLLRRLRRAAPAAESTTI